MDLANVQLPSWATLEEREGKIPKVVVNTDAAYLAMLTDLSNLPPISLPANYDDPAVGAETVSLTDPDDPDQYWLEVAFQCIKMELQLAMRRYDFEIKMADPEKVWAQVKFPEGRGWRNATKKREAKDHFRRMFGFVPG